MSQKQSGDHDLELALRACPVILGGCFGEETPARSHERLNAFLRLGGRVVETAHCYAGGAAELAVGDWLTAHSGARLRIITKVGHPTTAGRSTVNPGEITHQVRSSQQRIGVASLDLVLLHRDDLAVAVGDIVDSLHRLVAEGRVVRYGISNWSVDRAREFVRRARRIGDDPVLSYQYSLATPKEPLWPGTVHLNDELIQLAASHDTTVLAWAAQARGWFSRALPARAGEDPFDTPRNRAGWHAVDRIAARRTQPRPTVALAWALSQGLVHGATVGAANAEEVAENLAAAELNLDPVDLAELTAAASSAAAASTGDAS